MAQCSTCWGSGSDGSCYICNGSGRTKSSDGTYETSCSSCGGSGKRRCYTCGGSGEVADSSSTSSSSSSDSYSSGSYSSDSYSSSSSSDYSSSSSSYSGYTDQRNGYVSLFFGIAVGFGACLTADWILTKRFGDISTLLLFILGVFVLLAAIFWRNKWNIPFVILLAFSIPGWLFFFGVLPDENLSYLVYKNLITDLIREVKNELK